MAREKPKARSVHERSECRRFVHPRSPFRPPSVPLSGYVQCVQYTSVASPDQCNYLEFTHSGILHVPSHEEKENRKEKTNRRVVHGSSPFLGYPPENQTTFHGAAG